MKTKLRCIYCHEPLRPDTHEAHVIPQCLGGRLASKMTCCDECNNAIGAVESVLCESLRPISALLGARDSRNQPITATLKVVDKTFRYADGLGEEQLPAPKYDKEARTFLFPLPGDADDQATLIAKMLWDHGLTPGVIDAGKFFIEPDNTFGVRPYPPIRTPIETYFRFGDEEHMRAAAKMALELLAVRHPGESRRWNELKLARRFIRYGEGVFPVRTDAASQGSGLLPSQGLPVLAHAVEVWTHRHNLHFRTTFFGRLHVTGSLATNWQGPPLALLHALDPVEPGKHFDETVDQDGPSLGLWRPGLREENIGEFVAWVPEQADLVSERVLRRSFAYPIAPNIRDLQPLIKSKYEELCNERGRKRAKRKNN